MGRGGRPLNCNVGAQVFWRQVGKYDAGSSRATAGLDFLSDFVRNGYFREELAENLQVSGGCEGKHRAWEKGILGAIGTSSCRIAVFGFLVYIPMHRNDLLEIAMSPASEMLKTTEAAVVSRVALRDVNRAIDEGILPEGFFTHDDGRLVLAAACTLISFYFESARSLTSEERLFVIKVAVPRLRRSVSFELPALVEVDWIIQHEFLTIDFAPFVRGAVERLGGLVRARRLVHSSPEILGGTPVIRGTRIPVYDVAASAAAGISTERILAAYPGLDAEKIELATIFAQAYPPRGRPRTASSELPTGAVIVSDHRRPRRKKAK